MIMQETIRPVDILIADRDENLRSALKLLLKQDHHNIKITEAWNVESLKHSLCINKYNLIIIDWNFYRNRAYEVITDYRQSNTNTIVLSNRMEDKTHALAAGANAFIYKGDSPEYLQKTLLTYVKTASEISSKTPTILSSSPHPIYCMYVM
jgi:DNA-binding response OmpR family regulator